jgi:hypothetical protein
MLGHVNQWIVTDSPEKCSVSIFSMKQSKKGSHNSWSWSWRHYAAWKFGTDWYPGVKLWPWQYGWWAFISRWSLQRKHVGHVINKGSVTLHWSPFVITSLSQNVWPAVSRQNATEISVWHNRMSWPWQDMTALSPVYFYLEYIYYWSCTLNSLIFPYETTTKMKLIVLSNQQELLTQLTYHFIWQAWMFKINLVLGRNFNFQGFCVYLDSN